MELPKSVVGTLLIVLIVVQVPLTTIVRAQYSGGLSLLNADPNPDLTDYIRGAIEIYGYEKDYVKLLTIQQKLREKIYNEIERNQRALSKFLDWVKDRADKAIRWAEFEILKAEKKGVDVTNAKALFNQAKQRFALGKFESAFVNALKALVLVKPEVETDVKERLDNFYQKVDEEFEKAVHELDKLNEFIDRLVIKEKLPVKIANELKGYHGLIYQMLVTLPTLGETVEEFSVEVDLLANLTTEFIIGFGLVVNTTADFASAYEIEDFPAVFETTSILLSMSERTAEHSAQQVGVYERTIQTWQKFNETLTEITIPVDALELVLAYIKEYGYPLEALALMQEYNITAEEVTLTIETIKDAGGKILVPDLTPILQVLKSISLAYVDAFVDCANKTLRNQLGVNIWELGLPVVAPSPEDLAKLNELKVALIKAIEELNWVNIGFISDKLAKHACYLANKTNDFDFAHLYTMSLRIYFTSVIAISGDSRTAEELIAKLLLELKEFNPIFPQERVPTEEATDPHPEGLYDDVVSGSGYKVLIVTDGVGPITGISPWTDKDFWVKVLAELGYEVDWYNGVPPTDLLMGYDLVIYTAGGYWYPIHPVMGPLRAYHFAGKPLIVVAPNVNYDWYLHWWKGVPWFVRDVLHIEGALGILYWSSFSVYKTVHLICTELPESIFVPAVNSWPDCFDPMPDAEGVLLQGHMFTEFGVGTCWPLPRYSWYTPVDLYAVVAYPGSAVEGRVVTFGFVPAGIEFAIGKKLAENTIKWALTVPIVPPAVIQGTIIRPEGVGIRDANVDVIDSVTREVITSVKTDERGYFTTPPIRPGTYDVRSSKPPNYVVSTKTYTVGAGEVKTITQMNPYYSPKSSNEIKKVACPFTKSIGEWLSLFGEGSRYLGDNMKSASPSVIPISSPSPPIIFIIPITSIGLLKAITIMGIISASATALYLAITPPPKLPELPTIPSPPTIEPPPPPVFPELPPPPPPSAALGHHYQKLSESLKLLGEGLTVSAELLCKL